MAARLLAFVAAVAMVVGAVAVRNQMDDEGGNGGAGPSGNGDRDGVAALVCSTELRQVCEAIDAQHEDVEVTVEAVSVTLDRLEEGGATGVDAWFTAGPWADVLAAVRGDELFDAGTTVARTPIVMATWTPAASGPCPQVALACLADNLSVGTPADDTAAGVLVDAALVGAHIGNADYATNDLAGEPEGWLTALDQKTDAVRRNGVRTVTDLLVRRGAGAAAVVDLESAVGIVVAAAQSRDQVSVERTGSVVGAVVAPRRGSQNGRRIVEIVGDDRTKQALRSAGWRVSGGAPLAGIGTQPLPDDDGLPSPGVLHAVRDLVR